MPIDATIAISTRNRAGCLTNLLQSLSDLSVPDDVTWEVLVVDNGSTDTTGEVLESFRSRIPLRVIVEPVPGLSGARNRALEEASGELLIFTDDDCTVPPHWLANYLALARRFSLATVFGGPVSARFIQVDESLARALREHAPNAMTAFDFGPDDMRIDLNSHLSKLPFGANFAVRLAAMPGKRFNASLGRRGNNGVLLGGEETRFVWNLLLEGHVGWLSPSVAVDHWNGPDRANLEYLSRYCYAVGLQWSPTSAGPAAQLMIQRVVKRLRLAFLRSPLCRYPIGQRVRRIRDVSVELGALDSHTIEPSSRMVDASGRLIVDTEQ